MEGSVVEQFLFKAVVVLFIQSLCETKWFSCKVSVNRRDQIHMSVSVQAKRLHSTKQIKSSSSNSQDHFSISPRSSSSSSCSQSLLSSANIHTVCANIICNAEPFKNNLTKNNTVNKEELFAVPETSVSVPPEEALYSELHFVSNSLKSVTLCATKLTEERISTKLGKNAQKKDNDCTYSDKKPSKHPGRVCPI